MFSIKAQQLIMTNNFTLVGFLFTIQTLYQYNLHSLNYSAIDAIPSPDACCRLVTDKL